MEIRDVDNADLLIEMIEVGREPGGDTVLGRATEVTDACDMLGHWLTTLFHQCAAKGDRREESR